MSEALDIPLLLVDFLDDAAFAVLVFVHAAGPGFLALGAEAVHLVLAVVVPLSHCLLAQSFLHVRSQSQLRVCWHVASLLNLVDFPGDGGIDHFFGACRELVACLGSESGTHLSIRLFLFPDCRLDVLGQLFRRSVAHARRLGLAHNKLLIRLLRLGKHWLAAKKRRHTKLDRLTFYNITAGYRRLTLLRGNVGCREGGRFRYCCSSRCSGRHGCRSLRTRVAP